MNPSEHKNQNQNQSPPSVKKSNILPAIILLLLILFAAGTLFYFNSSSRFSDLETGTSEPAATAGKGQTGAQESGVEKTAPLAKEEESAPQGELSETEPPSPSSVKGELSGEADPGLLSDADAAEEASSCDKPTEQLSSFYRHLDAQSYMTQYQLPTSSRYHFDALIRKLLANPPQVTRESDDLYAILKNTAHFFRVCGKDNVLMLKGILDNEKTSLEQILADYHHLVTTPDCSQSPYASDIDDGALYEYACFFLNTMGGRLYLFRRDALSRMVVTYYAIMLIDQANKENNNHHGISLKPAVDMLIAEMEASGGALQRGDFYLDNLYGLKEKYQDQ